MRRTSSGVDRRGASTSRHILIVFFIVPRRGDALVQIVAHTPPTGAPAGRSGASQTESSPRDRDCRSCRVGGSAPRWLVDDPCSFDRLRRSVSIDREVHGRAARCGGGGRSAAVLIGTKPHSFDRCNDHRGGTLPRGRGASRVERSPTIPRSSTACATHACTAHGARTCHMRRESGTGLAVARPAHCLLDRPDLYELPADPLQSIEWDSVIGGDVLLSQ